MKQLTCEMCGSTELIKQDGFFVCQTCGCKYSVEEAKKMMIEGTVEVQGTIKVDETSKINNYLELAKVAYDGEDIQGAILYCDKVLEIAPENYHAWIIRAKTAGWGSTLANKKVRESITAAAQAIKFAPENEKEKVANELINALSMQIVSMCNLAENLSKVSLQQGIVHMHEVMTIWLQILKLPHANKETLRSAIELCETMCEKSKSSVMPYKRCLHAACAYNNNEPYWVTFKKAVLPEEITSEEENKKQGCYVATCVYGSYDCPEVWTLRRYRDNTLGSTWYGRAFIRAYYAISPTLVKWFGKTKWFKKMWKGKLDRMVKKLNDKGVEDTPYKDKNWK